MARRQATPTLEKVLTKGVLPTSRGEFQMSRTEAILVPSFSMWIENRILTGGALE